MITSIEPDVRPMGRYSVNETCALLGIHRITLRKYTALGYITPLANKPGIRSVRYPGREISRCWKHVTGGLR